MALSLEPLAHATMSPPFHTHLLGCPAPVPHSRIQPGDLLGKGCRGIHGAHTIVVEKQEELMAILERLLVVHTKGGIKAFK